MRGAAFAGVMLWRLTVRVALVLAMGAGALAAACEKKGPLETVPADVLGPRAVPRTQGPTVPRDAGPASDGSRPEVVSSYVLEGKRIQGETQIIPSEKVKEEMALSGLEKIVPTVKMCLDEMGDVSHLEVLSTSGFRTYDQQILGAMSHWKYEPHVVAGEARPICTTIQFVYEQTESRVAGAPEEPRETEPKETEEDPPAPADE